ncbi:hypothetical protein MSG28_009833 [Choristoneura fumiferana]|uniref:Uncharacterized protein n=1 Tax=Choristoneura fumiferana TaxID=7141 RepID=A0ACC0JCP8_CHOFU|nr:hypothetical protein MSG28_009833 [Choristoneura fumiferana]
MEWNRATSIASAHMKNRLHSTLHQPPSKENSDREDLKTDIQHRKETFYRKSPPADSAVSSAPASLSPQPHADMWPRRSTVGHMPPPYTSCFGWKRPVSVNLRLSSVHPFISLVQRCACRSAISIRELIGFNGNNSLVNIRLRNEQRTYSPCWLRVVVFDLISDKDYRLAV